MKNLTNFSTNRIFLSTKFCVLLKLCFSFSNRVTYFVNLMRKNLCTFSVFCFCCYSSDLPDLFVFFSLSLSPIIGLQRGKDHRYLSISLWINVQKMKTPTFIFLDHLDQSNHFNGNLNHINVMPKDKNQ